MAKRYFWLKLQDGFFDSLRIKLSRKLPCGDTAIVIYLKMQLKAIKNGGYLVFRGYEESFAAELAADLSEDAEAVRITLDYLLSKDLVQTDDNVNYFLPWAVENTGSEGASAERMRNKRTNGAQSRTMCAQSDGEIDKETKLYLEKKNKKRKAEAAETAASTSFQQGFQQESDFEQKREEALRRLEG